jgi:predicted transcriptional regulator
MRRSNQVATHTNSCRMNLGPLEVQVMETLWNVGEASVLEVQQRLPHKTAYTTVLTTLVRLFRKGLAGRYLQERRYIYAARISAEQWATTAASESIFRFLTTPRLSRELLLSCLMKTVCNHDPTLLPELEKRIRELRQISFSGVSRA